MALVVAWLVDRRGDRGCARVRSRWHCRQDILVLRFSESDPSRTPIVHRNSRDNVDFCEGRGAILVTTAGGGLVPPSVAFVVICGAALRRAEGAAGPSRRGPWSPCASLLTASLGQSAEVN